MDDVLVDVRRITDVCELPLLVDIDTGFGPSAFNIERTIKSLIKAGAAACHNEDQVGAKRRSEEHTSELQSLMRISYAVFSLKKKNNQRRKHHRLSKRSQILQTHKN